MNRSRMLFAVAAASAVACTLARQSLDRTNCLRAADAQSSPAAGEPLIVHEWGTFTCLQDETGRALGGINTDDEPVPKFVHRLGHSLLVRASDLAPIYYKGVPRFHPDVAMRLETPVMYFYPPRSSTAPMSVDVEVTFHGGWLTEFYPQADVASPRLARDGFNFGRLTAETAGTLQWNGLEVGVESAGPETDAHVWLAPRKVSAAALRSAGGESEKYLFYRGVANRPAPLSVVREDQSGRLLIYRQRDPDLDVEGPAAGAMWLVDVRADGSVAYRVPSPEPDDGRDLIATCPAEFDASAYSPAHLDALREEMRQALIADRLYADEAEAMLRTWELSYFKSPGTRLFFLLPQQWTDAVLPLRLSVPAQVSRTMVGRIELVTPRQRELLRSVASGSTADPGWLMQLARSRGDLKAQWKNLWEGRIGLGDLDVPVPPDYQAYVDLGRFRNALVLDALRERPSQGLADFAQRYRLSYFAPAQHGGP